MTALPAPARTSSPRATAATPALARHPSPIEIAFEREVSRVEHARRIGAAWLRNMCHMPAARVDSVAVVISELATNAVLYGGGSTVGLRLRHATGQVRLEINDHCPSAVPCPKQAGADEESGRGLWLVDALVEELGGKWGFTADGTVAWCVFPCRLPVPSENRSHEAQSREPGLRAR
ncbi:ATP-binding protein [Streptomyces sp. NPDC001401]|uniref:ATP-binding protein n=1 Tax=Streptomyces sp. NPDC001401 TaxID=3364570 RepID=UPI0036D0A3D5